MAEFPRTQIEDVSMPRLIVGTNWFLGYSHQTKARNKFIKELQTRERLADILEIFLRAGCDAIYGVRPESKHLTDAVKNAEDRVGRPYIRIGTPHLEMGGSPKDEDANKETLDGFAEIGCRFCLPHQSTTDPQVDRNAHCIQGMDTVAAMIRERNMIPGLSTHMPETIIYADATELDVATYIQLYNAAGFLMQVEIDWVHRIIWSARNPVMAIKPLAAGRLPPLVGLAFNWATLREQDMVVIGCMTPDEAREVIDISLSQLEGTGPKVDLQKTRSKKSLEYTDE